MHFPQANSPVAIESSSNPLVIDDLCCSYSLKSVAEHRLNKETEYVLLPEQTGLQSPNAVTTSNTVSQSTHYNVKPLHFSTKCGTFAQPYFK